MLVSELIESLKEVMATAGDVRVFTDDMTELNCSGIEINTPIEKEDEELYGATYLHIGKW